MHELNFFEKIRDNFIPIEKLYNKFFYTDKVGALLLGIPYTELNGETALINLLHKGYSKHHLLKLYDKQLKLEVRINKFMNKFRIYDPQIRKYVQQIKIQFGQGIEYLLLGEILEKDYGFKFDFTPNEVAVDNGRELCNLIELAINRMTDYFQSDRSRNTLRSIHKMIFEQRLAKKLEDDE